jgi:hypothetical protein
MLGWVRIDFLSTLNAQILRIRPRVAFDATTHSLQSDYARSVVLVELGPTDEWGRYVLNQLSALREEGAGRIRARLESLAPGHRPLVVELGEGAPARIVATLVDVLSAPPT